MRRPPFARPALALALLAAAGFGHAQDETYWYVEDDGVIAFEMEEGPQIGAWTMVEGAGALGAGYLRWDGPYGGPDSSEGRRLRYRFVVGEPGNYELRWRSRIDVGDENTEHNDSWVRFPTGVDVLDEEPLPGWTKVYMNHLDGWTWRTVTVDHVGRPLRQYLAAGEHEFEIAARSDGHGIDRVVLYRYDTLDMDDGKLDRLPLSLTTTDPAGVDDGGGQSTGGEDGGADGGQGTGGDTGGDGGAGGGDTAGGTAPEGDGEDAVPRQAIGSCEADRLVVGASDESGAASSDAAITDLLAGSDDPVWLAFDLSGVPPASAAALRLTPRIAADDSRALASWLGSSAEVDAPPDVAVALGVPIAGLQADATLVQALDASLLDHSGSIGIGVGFLDAGTPWRMAGSATESPDERPALVLSGPAGFCERWERLARELDERPTIDEGAGLVDEASEPDGGPGDAAAPQRSVEIDSEADPKGDADGGGLGVASLTALALLAGFGRRRRKRDRPDPAQARA